MRRPYEAGFVTDIDSDTLPPGLDESTVRAISARKQEPEWLLAWRLDAFRHWQSIEPPKWAHLEFPPIDYRAISYYSAPRSQSNRPQSLDEVDPALLRTYEKLGIPLHERAALAGVAVDVVFDSVSITTTFKEKLLEAGVIFCSLAEAVATHPELVRKYLGSVVPVRDNFLRDIELGRLQRRLVRLCAGGRALSDGALDVLSHQRAQHRPIRTDADHRRARRVRELSRRLHGAACATNINYMLPSLNSSLSTTQQIKYSTVQNWYPGDAERQAAAFTTS